MTIFLMAPPCLGAFRRVARPSSPSQPSHAGHRRPSHHPRASAIVITNTTLNVMPCYHSCGPTHITSLHRSTYLLLWNAVDTSA